MNNENNVDIVEEKDQNKKNDKFHLSEFQLDFKKKRKKANLAVLKNLALIFGSAYATQCPQIAYNYFPNNNAMIDTLCAVSVLLTVPFAVGVIRSFGLAAKAMYYNVNYKRAMKMNIEDNLEEEKKINL